MRRLGLTLLFVLVSFCMRVDVGADESAIEHTVQRCETARKPVDLHRFRIPLANAQVAFVDLGYRTPLTDALGQQTLLINGGYWAFGETQNRKIQGLLAVAGKRIAPRAPTLNGGVLVIESGRAELHDHTWNAVTERTTLAIQCNPRLVVAGQVVPKLEAKRLAARTALCIRDQGHTLDAYLTDDDARMSLSELASFLLAEGCEQALNLDGGPSTAAVFRSGREPLKVGSGYALPYGLGFTLAR